MVRIKFETGQEVEFEGTPTQADIDEVASRLGIVKSQPKEKGFLRTLAEDPIKTLLVKPADRFAEAVGRTGLLGKNIKTGYEQMADEGTNRSFGGITVEQQKGFDNGGLSQIVGETAKTVSYLYGGGQASTAFGTGLKGQVISGGIQGVKAGSAGGALYSFGDAIQQAENSASDVAYKTLFGGAVGGVTGGVMGVSVPLVVKTINGVKSYTNIEQLEGKLYKANKDIFKPTSTQMSDWAEKKVDPIKTFTREFGPEAIPTSQDKLGLDNLIEMTDARYKAGSQGFNTILRNSPEVVNLTSSYRKALEDINKSRLTPDLKESARQKLTAKFQSILNEAKSSGALLGKDNVPAWYADNLKDSFWGATKNFGSEESSVANTVNRSIGFSFKEGIEEVITDVNVKAYNKQLQELIYLRDFLESRNGKVPGTGGKMVRYTSRIIGGVAGSGGGPVGSVAGSITADKVAQAMINPSARTWVIRKQLEKLAPEVRKSLQEEAEQIIKNMALKRAGTARLGARTSATGFDVSPTAIMQRGKTTFEAQAGRVFNQSNIEGRGQALLPERASAMVTPQRSSIQPDITTPQSVAKSKVIISPKSTTQSSLMQEAKKYKSADINMKKPPRIKEYKSIKEFLHDNIDANGDILKKGDTVTVSTMYGDKKAIITDIIPSETHLPGDIKTKLLEGFDVAPAFSKTGRFEKGGTLVTSSDYINQGKYDNITDFMARKKLSESQLTDIWKKANKK